MQPTAPRYETLMQLCFYITITYHTCMYMYMYFISDPFLVCKDVIDPTSYVEACRSDVCALGLGSHCTAFARYSRDCALRGIVIEWRTLDPVCSELKTSYDCHRSITVNVNFDIVCCRDDVS